MTSAQSIIQVKHNGKSAQRITHPPILLKASARPVAKLKKTIEILIVPNPLHLSTQKNVGITIDPDVIKGILSKAYKTVSITVITTEDDLERLVERRPDLVFSGVKYFSFDDKKIWLNDYLDMHKICYIGSSCQALDKEHDKSIAKTIVKNAGIATADFFTSAPGEHPTLASVPLPFPLFIKPVKGGDSIGVDARSIANDFDAMNAKITEIHQLQKTKALLETFLSGKEYSVGIFEDNATGELIAMPIEIVVNENENGQRILDFFTKKNDAETVCKVTNMKIHRQLSDLAKATFKALGGKSFGRIDVKMSADNIPNFVEANLMPGLRKGYFYRACSLNLGLSYAQMIIKIAHNRMAP